MFYVWGIICQASDTEMLHVTFLAPRTLRWLQIFRKCAHPTCRPLTQSVNKALWNLCLHTSGDSGRLTLDNALVTHLYIFLTSSNVSQSETFSTLFGEWLVRTSTTKYSILTAGFWFPSAPLTFYRVISYLLFADQTTIRVSGTIIEPQIATEAPKSACLTYYQVM